MKDPRTRIWLSVTPERKARLTQLAEQLGFDSLQLLATTMFGLCERALLYHIGEHEETNDEFYIRDLFTELSTSATPQPDGELPSLRKEKRHVDEDIDEHSITRALQRNRSKKKR